MKIDKLISACLHSLFIIFFSVSFLSCQDEKKKDPENQTEEIQESKKETERGPDVTTIVTNAMEFKTKDKLDSGWHTFRYNNKSNETHFVLFDRYPDGYGIENAKTELIPPFQEGMNFIIEGKMEEANAAFAKIPEWFQGVKFKGGVGLISANSTAESTIYLEPGTYILECYVKMPNGMFHSAQGMVKEIQVVAADSSKAEIREDYTVSINATEGIVFNQNPSAGKKIFKVDFGEQKVYENYVMHDVHLVWVGQGSDISQLNDWMNWAAPEGLQTPAPQGFKFLGGMQEMDSGGTGYFTADLRPGNYALIAEIPDPQGKGMLKTFTVK
ncbi:hypothetical protein [Christiangramia sabulilitoris]|uniref:Uncharacterized protein n=1 Tax=Christiangramia sabulilitoris TaxID=2583991 RepID=A0A550I804_9FLAO|nr:hypothetical protein [Christiangramia sabulilitoris]TRO67099.1 hypothetical protein FGM01_04215 [Christiangramia sabulilitoris]